MIQIRFQSMPLLVCAVIVSTAVFHRASAESAPLVPGQTVSAPVIDGDLHGAIWGKPPLFRTF